MARAKLENKCASRTDLPKADERTTLGLGIAFEKVIASKYGHLIAPPPIITPTNIKPLDAILGGGIVSSGPVLLSSTPETGKSTVAFQISSMFQKLYHNSIIVYLDIEGSGNTTDSKFQVSRIESFGLDVSRFKYEPIVMNVMELFELIGELCSYKKKFEEATNQEFYVLIIWDSIAATPSSKVQESDNPNSTIGTKARQLSYCLEKYSPDLKFNKVTFIGIDQVRANISMEGPYAQKEKSVGVFKDLKSASNIYALQHNVQQWLFMSKKGQITINDGMGIDGWYVDIYTEKNKVAPSQHWVRCVFDKNRGLSKFWTEFTFLSEQTPGEYKLFKNKVSGMNCPLMIKQNGAYYNLHVKAIGPDGNKIEYKSDNFYKKDALQKYETDKTFSDWFNYAVDYSIQSRIVEGLFKNTDQLKQIETEELTSQEYIDPDTGEVTTTSPDNLDTTYTSQQVQADSTSNPSSEEEYVSVF